MNKIRLEHRLRQHWPFFNIRSSVHSFIFIGIPCLFWVILKNQPRCRLGQITAAVLELHLRLPLKILELHCVVSVEQLAFVRDIKFTSSDSRKLVFTRELAPIAHVSQFCGELGVNA